MKISHYKIDFQHFLKINHCQYRPIQKLFILSKIRPRSTIILLEQEFYLQNSTSNQPFQQTNITRLPLNAVNSTLLPPSVEHIIYFH